MPIFANYQETFDREKACDPANRKNDVRDRPSHPFHVLEADAQKRAEFERLADKLFNQHLEFDYLSGKVGYRVGRTGVEAPPVTGVTSEYYQALAELPRLDEQGDGMRCALGLLLPLMTTMYAISLIDEPEAFLHPPQARILGNETARLAGRTKSQLIVATHDKNYLQGLVEVGAPVAIIHLTRSGNSSRARLLDTDKVRELWSDTTLRYGNALDGLFHDAVIVTESDRDSQFYVAAVDHVHGGSDEMRADNMMFLGAYGKTNLASIVQRLTDLGVRTVSSPDLDILNDDQVLRALVEAHGGNWSVIEPNYRKATNQFRQPIAAPTLAVIMSQITRMVDEANTTHLTPEIASQIRALTAMPSAWKQLKLSGYRAFRNEKAAATALLEDLEAIGIVAVRVGELENFLTTADAAKGAGFLRVAFEQGAHKGEDARRHATRLLAAAGQLR